MEVLTNEFCSFPAQEALRRTVERDDETVVIHRDGGCSQAFRRSIEQGATTRLMPGQGNTFPPGCGDVVHVSPLVKPE
ncbi:hypothetical protein GCM10010372_77010 [Streptomyces tauricus]|nr:hypothetical protein GCM10010372_77010 [Streptomyces tauricus]